MSTPLPPPEPCPGYSLNSPAPEGFRWEWRQTDDRWQAPAPAGMLCRYTVGPGHATCRRPAVATLLRGRSRWGYCEIRAHLFARRVHDGVVWEPVAIELSS